MDGHNSKGVFQDVILDATRYPGADTFDLFLELISGFPLRSTYEYKDSEPFHSRWVTTQTMEGTAIRWSCVPHISTRNANHIADSGVGGYAILYTLSGFAQVAQNGKEIEVKPGCGVIYDVDQPGHIDMRGQKAGEYFVFTVPREVAHASAPTEDYQNPLRAIPACSPLLRCVDYLSDVLSRKSPQELAQVYKACSALLVAEFLSVQGNDSSTPRSSLGSADIFSRILAQIDREAGNFAMSPEWLAKKFGISVRQVHKLFAREGLTCQSYIMNVRLNYAKNDLATLSHKVRMATLAYRWGFTDPSSFGRAFRQRFGCSPGSFQSKVRS